MSKIVSPAKASQICQSLKRSQKSVVLVGGCFDILHIGHIQFLEKAKKIGDYLLVLLESDDQVRKLKGIGRPINDQQSRANRLSALKMVDLVLLLPEMDGDQSYDELVKKIKPSIIATTSPDPLIKHKERVAKLSGAKLAYVIKRVPLDNAMRHAPMLGIGEG